MISALWLATQFQREQTTSQVTTASKTPSRTTTPQSIKTQTMTSTPDPLALGEQLEQCGSDLCIVDSQGKRTSLGLDSTYISFRGYSWSPDKTQIVFAACLVKKVLENPGADCYSNVFVTNLDGSNAVDVTNGVSGSYFEVPAWSPDGEWIVFSRSGALTLIRPDGSGNRALTTCCAFGINTASAWSPDSQRIATVGGICGNKCTVDRIFYINKDGSGFRVLFHSPDIEFDSQIAWSPDGQSVNVILQNGTAYQIDANCQSDGLDGCDASSRTEIPAIPQDWFHTFRPQWLSAYADPKSAVYGCGIDDKLLFAEDFESPEVTQLGIWQVGQAPDGRYALHALNPDVATAFVTFPLVGESVAERQISFDVMSVAPEWGIDFRIDPVLDRFNYDISTAGTSEFKLRYWFGQDAHAQLGSTTKLQLGVWTSVDVIWESENTIVVNFNDIEAIRYVEPNPVIERGGIKLWLYTANAEAWFDDIVICGQE